MKTIESLEPFAWGYLRAGREDIEYRIASGMRLRAEYAPILLTTEDTFATFFDKNEPIGVRYVYGDGITVRPDQLKAEKAEYPHLAADLEEILEKVAPLDRVATFHRAKTDVERTVGDYNVMWGGDWGGHSNPDYHALVHLGTKGLRERNEHCRAQNPAKDDFYDALNVALDAVDRLAHRGREMALALAESADNAGRARLMRIADALAHVPMHPARDFFEAVQSFWLVFTWDGIDSPGLFEYTMADYYHGTEEDRTLLDALWQLFYKTRTWNLCISGSDENGRDRTTQLSYDILEVARKYRYNTPNLTLRVHRGTPDALWESAAKTLATGIGLPSIYNDEVVCPALEDLGIPPAHAHLYCMNGCNQIDIFGKSHMGLEDGEVSLAKCLELTLHNGYSPLHNAVIGLPTGDAAEFATFDALMDAYKRQVEYVTDLCTDLANKGQRLYAQFSPNPLRSNLMEGCAESGRDYKNGGPLYGHGQILAEGIADTADSLYAIRHLVYETKQYTMAQLIAALQTDFAESEALRRDFARCAKFGNDIPEVDRIAGEIVDHFNRYLLTKRTFRGGQYGGGCSPFNRAARYGKMLGAMPNGRHRDDTLFADSIGAVPGADHGGPTALLNSVLHFDQVKAKSGFILNLKFTKEVFDTDRGRAAFIQLAKAYFARGGQNLSVAVLSAEELKDAKIHPERHGNLIVRVGGYSDYFCNLAPDLQENIIARTELMV